MTLTDDKYSTLVCTPTGNYSGYLAPVAGRDSRKFNDE